MEDLPLDELANLIDEAEDDFDSDDEFIAQLYNSHEQCENTSSQDAQDEINTSIGGVETETAQENQISPENMSKKITDMQKYIEFLEGRLKTQNEEKKKSPENKLCKESTPLAKCDSASSTKKFYNQSTPTRSETSSNRKLSANAASSTSPVSQNSSDAFVKKSRVAHTPSNERRSSGQKRKAEEPAPQSSAAKKPAQDDSNGITDGYSGLRIVNRLVSSAVMERRMEGRKVIKISSIQSKIRNNDIEGDWVTIGVLIQKMPGKTTSKGEAYSLWKISDLAFHLQTSIVFLFLFGENHKEHWKTSEGSVIALLNPSILPPREKGSSDVALSLDNAKKLMIVGTSQDFGVCQSSRKSDGARCSNFVNKSQGNYCSYHVCREYSKKRAKRMECQQGYGAPSKPPGSKRKKDFTSDSFFYKNSIVSSYPSPVNRKEKVTLKNLNASSSGGKNLTGSSSTRKDYLSSWKDKQSEKKSLEESSGSIGGPSEDFLTLLNIPTAGSRNLKIHLHKEEEKEVNEARPALSASEFLKANKVQRKNEEQVTSSVSRTRTQSTTEARPLQDPPSLGTPMLGRGLNCHDDIVFDENVPSNFAKKSSSSSDRAKKRALAIVRKTGPLKPKDPNNVRAKKPSPKQQNAIKSKLESDEEPVSNSGKTFSLADGFSLDSEEGRRILKAKSRHIGEVRQAEIRQEQAYFTSREKKEEMEAKMLSVKQLEVKVVHCPQCKYVAESPGAICKEENHKLKSLRVMKKFFSCRECGERTVAYGQRFPTHECRKCGAKNYEKCSMWKEKSGPKIGGETLLLRGPEYGKFLNSLQTTKTNGILPKYL